MLLETKQKLRGVILPLARWCAAAGILADQLTLAGLVAALFSGLAVALGNPLLGFIWLLVSALCDLLDGDVARLSGRDVSPFGAFLDSTSDRVAELLVLGGLLIGQGAQGGGVGWFWAVLWLLALSGSYMVSYARARAEGLGLSCRVGFGDRSLRLLLLMLLLIFGFRASGVFLALLAVLAWFTVGQRLLHVYRITRPAAAEAGSAASPDASREAPPEGAGDDRA